MGLLQTEIEAEIILLEKKYLTLLLGPTLYNTYAAATSQEWTDFKTGCSYTNLDGEARVWGAYDLKNMLLGFMYYELTDNYLVKNTTTGIVNPKNENSDRKSKFATLEDMYDRWNRSIDLYRKAYNYIFHTKESKGYDNWAFSQLPYKKLINI